ncbi:methyltransferase domain-containing protein [Geodermatophilus sp. URMC 63]
MTDRAGMRVGAEYLRQAAVAVAELKARSHEALDLGSAARVLDLGCGPGLDAWELAGRGRQVIGVDHDADLLAAAQGGDDPRPRFVRADAHALPFSSASFDAVRAERLLQHVADPAGVIGEMSRVTRVGGRLVLVDTDWASLSIGCGPVEIERRIVAALLGQVARHPTAGRDLLRHAADLPLEILSVTVHPLTSGDPTVVRQIAHLDLAERLAVDNGSLGPEDLQQWHRSLRTAGRRATLLATIDLVVLIARRR